MPIEFVPEVLCALKDAVTIAPGAEITCEANPETFTLEHAKAWAKAGVNRLSFGVQSMDDAILAHMGRGHRAKDVPAAIGYARAAGIQNISVDAIYGYPGQSMESWQDTLNKLCDLAPQHISCYCLTPEEGTPLYHQLNAGHLTLDEDAAADMGAYTIGALAARGYTRYEISNYAKPGFESRHNSVYWRRQGYMGMGAGAHGCVRRGGDRLRYCHSDDIIAYEKELASGDPFPNAVVLTKEEMMFEAVMLFTRMVEGLDLTAFQKEFGVDFFTAYPRANYFVQQGLARVQSGRFCLTLRGMEVQNSVLMEFLPD